MTNRPERPSTPKVVAIVQARMGSTRLPGKVLMDLEGKPILRHVVDRLKQSQGTREIVIATSAQRGDDPIQSFCEENGFLSFRGNEHDVLDRYYQAAIAHRADVIVRITADCPLIDPEVLDRVIQTHLSSGTDYTSNTLKRTYPRGLDNEVFSSAALQKAWELAMEPAEREHVTAFLYRHPELFRLASVEAEPPFCQPDIRICVDTLEDLELVRAVYRELKDGPIRLKDIVRLFDRKPQLLALNASVQQKTL